jgi:hypothetical protein
VIGVGGWHSPEGVARGEVRVVGDARGRGVGSSLLAELSSWASSLGYAELMGPVKETDDVSLAWAQRRGFVEVGRNSLLVLDLTGIEAPAVEHPDGVEIVSWAERPDVVRGMYAVAREAYPDVPGEEDAKVAPVRALAVDGHAGRRRPARGNVCRPRRRRGRRVREAGAVACAAGGSDARHDRRPTRVARPRHRPALKAAEIAWAKKERLRAARHGRPDRVKVELVLARGAKRTAERRASQCGG